MIQIHADKLQRIKEIIEKLEELNRILEEYSPYLREAEELGLIVLPEGGKDRPLRVSFADSMAYGEEVKGNGHMPDEDATGLEALFGSDREPVDVILPRTVDGAEVHVFQSGTSIVLEWWHAGRKEEEVEITDEWALYSKIREMAKDGKLTFSKFWKKIRKVDVMTLNKAHAIFNYYGLSQKFGTRLEWMSFGDGIRQVYEWTLVFEDSPPHDTGAEGLELAQIVR